MQARANQVPTNGFHETRNTRHESRVFVEPPQARPTGFSRDTRHETRLFPGLFSNHRLDALPAIAHHCPALPTIARLPRGRSASWMQRLPAQASLSRKQEPPPANTAREPRPNRRPGFWVTNHETRITKHGFSHGLSPKPPGSNGHTCYLRFWVTKHETRNTRHGLYHGLSPRSSAEPVVMVI